MPILLAAVLWGTRGREKPRKESLSAKASSEEPLPAFERAKRRTDFSDPRAVARLGLWALWNEEPERAEELLEKSYQMAPNDNEVSARLAEYLVFKRADLTKPSPAELCQLGERAKNYGLDPEARRFFGEALQIDPSLRAPWEELGYVEVATTEGDKIWRTSREAVALGRLGTRREERQKYLESLPPRAREVERVKDQLAEDFGPDFDTLEEPPFLLCLEKGNYAAQIRLEDLAEKIRDFYQGFYAEYGEKFSLGDLQNEALIVWVFKDREAYQRYGLPRGIPPAAGGHFEHQMEGRSNRPRLVIYNDTPDPYGTIFHECTHQVIYHVTRLKGKEGSNMLWFTEGIATFFEPFRRDPAGKVVQGIGVPNSDRLPMIRKAAKESLHNPEKPAHIPFSEMFGKEYVQFMREMNDPLTKAEDRLRKGLLYYGEAWSIVYFFYNHDGGKYRPQFEDYFRREIHGEGGVKTAAEVFGDLKKLEEEWLQFVNQLPTS